MGLLHQDDGRHSRSHISKCAEVRLSSRMRTWIENCTTRGRYRGEFSGPADDFGRRKVILLDAYRLERFTSSQDWVLALEVQEDAN